MIGGMRPFGRIRFPCCLMLAAALLIPAFPMDVGGPPSARAESVWRTDSFPDFNASGSSMTGLVLNGTGTETRIELARTSDWYQIPVVGPSAREDAAMAAIGADGKIVLFGGFRDGFGVIDDTWVFDTVTKKWTKKDPPVSPSARAGHSIASVFNDDKVVLFGGSDYINWSCKNDTWVYDLSDDRWTPQSTNTSPSGRVWAAEAAASNDDRIVLFGGYLDGAELGDTWTYDVAESCWTRISTYAPGARQQTAMASVSTDDKAVLFGGYSTRYGYQTDSWSFDFSDRQWFQLNPQTAPSTSDGHGMATIFNDDRVILFGGWNYPSDTWLYDISEDSWQFQNTVHRPGARGGLAIATPLGADRTVIFGGSGGSQLADTWMFYMSGYSLSGEYVSAPFDTGAESSFLWLNWTASVPQGTRVLLQLRTADTKYNLSTAQFLGPDGSVGDYYISNSSTYYGSLGHRWVQYKAYLNTSDIDVTPSIEQVSLTYNMFPQAPVPSSPPDGCWINTTYPNFTWALNDTDSFIQGGFQWEAGPGPLPSSMNLSSEDVSSDLACYVHDDPLGEGTWYWRVRTRDAEGDWGPFCAFQQVGIDVIPPRPLAPYAIPDSWTASRANVWFSTSDNRSGIEDYTVWIDGKPYGTRDSPFQVPESVADGIHAVQVRAHDRAGNHADGKVRVYIDRTPPEPFTPHAPVCWTRADPVIEFETTDRTSGIDRYEIKVDTGIFWPSKSPATLGGLGDGVHDVLVRAYDKAGNFRDANLTVLRDRRGPVDLQLAISPSGWTATDPIVSFSANEEASDIDRYEVGLDGGPFRNQTSPFTVANLSDGIHTLAVRAYDLAGNFAEQTGQLYIDRTPPARFSPSAEPSGWTRADPVVSFETTDESSEIRGYYLKVDEDLFSKTKSPCPLPQLSDGRHIVTVRAVDNAGNHMDGTVEVSVDREAPVGVSVIINGGRETAGGRRVRLTVAAQDYHSGPAQMCFSPDGAFYSDWEPFSSARNWTLPPGGGEKTVYVRVRDAAGNEARAASATIVYKPPEAGPTAPISLFIALGMCLATAAGFFIWRRMKGAAPPRPPAKPAAGSPSSPSAAPKGLK